MPLDSLLSPVGSQGLTWMRDRGLAGLPRGLWRDRLRGLAWSSRLLEEPLLDCLPLRLDLRHPLLPVPQPPSPRPSAPIASPAPPARNVSARGDPRRHP
eukprot:6659537-Pyramimonas_sp.AAC.1